MPISTVRCISRTLPSWRISGWIARIISLEGLVEWMDLLLAGVNGGYWETKVLFIALDARRGV